MPTKTHPSPKKLFVPVNHLEQPSLPVPVTGPSTIPSFHETCLWLEEGIVVIDLDNSDPAAEFNLQRTTWH